MIVPLILKAFLGLLMTAIVLVGVPTIDLLIRYRRHASGRARTFAWFILHLAGIGLGFMLYMLFVFVHPHSDKWTLLTHDQYHWTLVGIAALILLVPGINFFRLWWRLRGWHKSQPIQG